MQQLADRLGLSELVHFLGHREDIPDLLGAMDIFVLPSHSEGVSLALLEAMAAGLPVIVSDVGGLPEVVRHGENGLVIPVKDPQALAQALEKLLADPTYAHSLGESARREVKAHYSLERLGRDINEIYQELAEKEVWGRGQGIADPLTPPPNPQPQSLKFNLAQGKRRLRPAASAYPLMRVGRGVWGEGRDLRSLALPPLPLSLQKPRFPPVFKELRHLRYFYSL